MRKQILLTLGFASILAIFLSANIWLDQILVKPFANQTQLDELIGNPSIQNQQFEEITKQQRTLVHVKQSLCLCNAYSNTHIQTLNVLADQSLIQVIDVSLDALTQLQQSVQWQTLLALVPSTPATVLINSQGKIEYIGPYSSGLTCNSGNSFIEGFLSQPEGDLPIANWINTGCYCNTDS